MLETPDLWRVMHDIVFPHICVHACMHAHMCVQTCRLMQAYMLVQKDRMDMQAEMPIQAHAL